MTKEHAIQRNAQTPAGEGGDAATPSGRLLHTLAQFRRRDGGADHAAAAHQAMSAPAFRAAVAARLHALERDVAEMRSRINGLLFVVAGAVVTQVVLRLFGA
jgi:hypothetical protein